MKLSHLALVGLLACTPAASAQDAAARKPLDAYQGVRDQLNVGAYEVAADLLKDFANLKPGEQDFLDIEAKYGPTTFLKLRTVPRWYDDPKRDAEFKTGVVEALVTGSLAANQKFLKDPARIDKFVRNLSASKEEVDYAIAELKRSGDAVVPRLIDSLRVDLDPAQRAGIYRAVGLLNIDTVPGILAAVEGLNDEFKIGLLTALSRRPDVLTLFGNTDTNFVPLLWYLAGTPADRASTVRDMAALQLHGFAGESFDRRSPSEELVRLAQPLIDRKGTFAAVEKSKNRIKLWTFDKATQAVKVTEVTAAVAEETFGLKYLKWAVERQPANEAAQDSFLALATERAVERANYADLSKADPAAYGLLASASTTTLVNLLDGALAENKTALALGIAQALGDRGDRIAATGETKANGTVRPPVLVKALTYADPRVQLAAALALLKIPGVNHGANARIVDVLKRAATTDAGSATSKGRAIIADPDPERSDRTAGLLRLLGYRAEIVSTGRQLTGRIARSSDFDLLFIDRHIANPGLVDLLPLLRSNADSAKRPVLIVASADESKFPGLETQLTRLTALIAATETVQIDVPAPLVADRRKPTDVLAKEAAVITGFRERSLANIYNVRLARLNRLVAAANLTTTAALKARLDLRLSQLTYAGLIADFDLTATSGPAEINEFARQTELIRRQTDLDAAVKNVNTEALINLVRQIEAILPAETAKRFDAIRARLTPESLAIPPDPVINAAAEAAIERIARPYAMVSVIREPWSVAGFADDLKDAVKDPAQLPRTPAEKATAAKMAVEALRRIAVGEIAGYDIRPADSALREAAANDGLALTAVAALAAVPTAEAQQELLKIAATAGRPVDIRSGAIDAAIRQLQTFGKLSASTIDATVVSAANTESDPGLKSKLNVLRGILVGKASDLADRIKDYTPGAVTPEAAPAAKPAEAKPEN